MGRNKADGSGPKQHRKRYWRGPQATFFMEPRTRVSLEQRSCLVIVKEQVLSHAPSMRNTKRQQGGVTWSKASFHNPAHGHPQDGRHMQLFAEPVKNWWGCGSNLWWTGGHIYVRDA